MGMIGWTLALLAVLVVVLAWRKKKPGAASAAASEADEFIAETVARAVAKRSSLDAEQVATALGGSPEPEVVAKVEELVKSVEVAYAKLPGSGPKGGVQSGDYELKVEVRFEDGTTFDRTRQLGAADLPKAVRDEFGATGGARVYRSWDLPWAR